MRDSTKVVIGIGSIWGLYALGAMLLSAFTVGTNDSGPEITVIVLYGLSILPACLLAIWFRKYAALWLIALAPITAAGFFYQVLSQAAHEKNGTVSRGSIATALIVAGIPAVIGVLLLKSESGPAESH